MQMATTKYLAFDVHQATSTFTLRAADGRVLQRGVVETTARDLVALLRSFGRNLHVTFEEGTQAQWLHDLLLPHCERLLVCNPRATREKLGTKSDRVDAGKLSEFLRLGSLKPVFHAQAPTRPLKELVRAYTALVADSTRVMLRIKAIYRGRGIGTRGEGVYRTALRKDWLAKIEQPAARRRAEIFLAQLDALSSLRKVFKAIAADLSHSDTPLGEAHRARVARGMQRVGRVRPKI